MGTILFNGLLNKVLKPAESTTKGYKNLASFGAIEIKSDSKSIKFCKIPVSLIY